MLRKVCFVGLQRFIEAWNNHPIPHKGIPNTLQASRNGTTAINPVDIPSKSDAVATYRQQGGSLTDPGEFREDPLQSNAHLQARREDMWQLRCGSCDDLYTTFMQGSNHDLQMQF